MNPWTGCKSNSSAWQSSCLTKSPEAPLLAAITILSPFDSGVSPSTVARPTIVLTLHTLVHDALFPAAAIALADDPIHHRRYTGCSESYTTIVRAATCRIN